MINVGITAKLAAECGPHERYVDRITLPGGWARNWSEAQANLLTLLVTERYFPQAGHAPGQCLPPAR